MNVLKNNILIYLLVSATLILYFYGNIIFNPNSYIFSDKGDGITHYYTYAYYITNNKSYIEFEGMNFPYNEHINYSVGHPFIAVPLKALSQVFPTLKQYCIGILNLILTLQQIITGGLILFILTRLNITKWLAISGAISIMLLSPQIFRIGGHPSLSYSLCIPLCWALLIKITKKSNTLKWLILLMIIHVIWFFIHPYLAIISSSFSSIYLLVYHYIKKDNWLKDSAFKIIITTVFPLLFFISFNASTDKHTQRTDNPSGFFLYNAEPDDIFIPHHPPLRPIIDKVTDKIRLNWEAWSYIGAGTIIVLLLIFIKVIKELIAHRNIPSYQRIRDNRILFPSLVASGVLLLFSFGIPFKQFPPLLDIFSPFKLLRATCRFTWPFFYVINIFAIVVIDTKFLKNKKKTVQAIMIPISFICLMFLESLPYHIEVAKSISKTANPFQNYNTKSVIPDIEYQEYQAILPIPFYHYGSESFGRPIDENSLYESTILSYHSSLPIITSNLARISIEESKNLVQLISPSYYDKSIEKDIPNNKKILLQVTKSETTHYEQQLLLKSTFLKEVNGIKYYEISKRKLFKNTSREERNYFYKNSDKLYENGDFLLTKPNQFIFWNGFDDKKSEYSLIGKGAYMGKKKGLNSLAQFARNTFERNKVYKVSAWMRNSEKDALNLWFRFIVVEIDNDGNIVSETTTFPDLSETIFGEWSLVELNFKVLNSNNQINIVTKGKKNSKAQLIVDELLINEENCDVYKLCLYKGKDAIQFNNHILV